MIQEDITLVRPDGLERSIYDDVCVEKTGDNVSFIIFLIFLSHAFLSTRFAVFFF